LIHIPTQFPPYTQKRKRNKGRKTKFDLPFIEIALHNLNRIKGKQSDVIDLLKGRKKNVPTPHIYGVTEHAGNGDIKDTDTHIWFGIDKPTHDGLYGGVGAYVAKKIANLTTILHEHSDHNILWLRIVTADVPLFIAIIYTNPKDNPLLTKTLERAKETYSLLSGLGRVLLMGDLNCRLGRLTRDKDTDQQRASILKDFFLVTSTRPLINDQIKHWTCYKNGGSSVNDLFIAQKQETKLCRNYRVHSEHMFGSDHALLSFQWKVGTELNTQENWSTSFLSLLTGTTQMW
jgi:hypothetical protein